MTDSTEPSCTNPHLPFYVSVFDPFSNFISTSHFAPFGFKMFTEKKSKETFFQATLRARVQSTQTHLTSQDVVDTYPGIKVSVIQSDPLYFPSHHLNCDNELISFFGTYTHSF